MKRVLLSVFPILLAALIGAGALCACRQEQDGDDLYYFYENVCASCDVEGQFQETLRARLSGLEPVASFQMVNTFTDGTSVFEQQCEKLEIPEEQCFLPMVVIGERYVCGESKIELLLRSLYCDYRGITDTGTIWYYYRPDCGDCERVEELVESMKEAYPSLLWVSVDTTDPEPKALFKEQLAQWGVPESEWQVPFVWNGREYLSGDGQIEAGLEEFLSRSEEQAGINDGS